MAFYRDFAIEIPSSLRTIQPFLSDGLKFANAAFKVKGYETFRGYAIVAITSINSAFRINSQLASELSPEDRHCLDDFLNLRNNLSSQISIPTDNFPYYASMNNKEVGAYELLICEAEAILNLANIQNEQHMPNLVEDTSSSSTSSIYPINLLHEAALNYHTACIFFRVMETMVPSKCTPEHHKNLKAAYYQLKKVNRLHNNLVRESFNSVIGSCGEHYEVHGSAKLGKGSYGSVYLATNRITGDERAVKVMNVDRITSYYLRKLHTEISILKSLDHPNIIKVQDVFFGKRSVYIVTAICRGGELFELLNNGKSQGFVFKEDRAAKLMRDMLSAVNYLHNNNIVHRDLKLENFLFEDQNASSPLILIDFGLSKHFSKGEKMTQKVGSCYYTAPEVLNGYYDHMCDVWSLGVLCYMLLSGSPPFYGRNVEDVYQSILTKEPNFSDKKFRHLSNDCMDFMKRLLTRDPSQRITTSEALLHPFIVNNSHSTPLYALNSGGVLSNFRPGPTSSTPTLPPINSPTGSISGPHFSFNEQDINKSSSPENSTLNTSQLTVIIESMITYAGMDPLIKITLRMIAHSLGYKDLYQFRVEFQLIDYNYLGTITRKDFINLFYSLCSTPSLHTFVMNTVNNFESLKKLYNSILELSGYISSGNREMAYHDYVTATLSRRVHSITEAQLVSVFSLLDSDNEKKLTASSLSLFLGQEIAYQDCEMMINVADYDKKGYITLQDFKNHWYNVWGRSNNELFRYK